MITDQVWCFENGRATLGVCTTKEISCDKARGLKGSCVLLMSLQKTVANAMRAITNAIAKALRRAG